MKPLRDYQVIAVDHLRAHTSAALFLDMGLGKTAITLSALTPDHLPALVTAPKRVAENVWETEAKTFRPDLKVAVAKGSPRDRSRILSGNADVVVLGRDNLRDALEFLGKFRTLIVDETSGFKSWSSVRFKTAKKIIPHVDHVWGLTGTPDPNGLLDLWSQVYLLDQGARLGKNITSFRGRYFTPGRQLANGTIIEWNLRPGADVKIYNLVSDICLSMESDGRVVLPEVTYNPVVVPLPPAARTLYKKMKDDLVADLRTVGLDGGVHTAANAAVLSSKLSQLTAGFLYADDADLMPVPEYTRVHLEKVRAVREIVEGSGSPVLVAYQYRAERDMIKAALPEQVHFIDEPDIVNRWNRGEIPVLLAHPASIGHGLNLQTGPGHTIVWASLTWNLEEWLQFNRRIARPGQAHPVVIHMLMSPRTVDGAKQARLVEKKSVQDALLAHLESPL